MKLICHSVYCRVIEHAQTAEVIITESEISIDFAESSYQRLILTVNIRIKVYGIYPESIVGFHVNVVPAAFQPDSRDIVIVRFGRVGELGRQLITILHFAIVAIIDASFVEPGCSQWH